MRGCGLIQIAAEAPAAACSYMALAPHLLAIPGFALMGVVLSFNLLGDGLRDALDPKLRR